MVAANTMDVDMCPCGQPLHDTDPSLKLLIDVFVENKGLTVPVKTHDGREYLVNRHYIALHGIKTEELEGLAAAGVITKVI